MPRQPTTPTLPTDLATLMRTIVNETAERVRQVDHDLLIKIEVKVDTMQTQINDLAATITKRTDELEGEIKNRNADLEKRITALESDRTRRLGAGDVLKLIGAGLTSGGIGAAIIQYFLRR